MVRKDRKNKKTTHIAKDLHKIIDLFKAKKEFNNIENAIEFLIKEGLRYQKEKGELPDFITEEFGSIESKKENIELSDLPKDIIEFSKRLEGGKVGSKESVREIALGNLRYLINNKKASKKDFIKNVYPRFEEDHSKDSYWKISQFGFKQLSDLTDKINTPTRGHSIYKWKA